MFLNACDAGALVEALGPGGTGFPRAFSDLGARAVVAPLWPVSKHAAPRVAKEIYAKSVAQPEHSVAEIIAELRQRSYDEDPFDDSWAAYCFFGDPRASLRRVAAG